MALRDALLPELAQELATTRAMNHLIHHRGQFSVYLRLVDVPLPPIYGPTADMTGEQLVAEAQRKR